jgi:hypothetical protein
MKARTRRSEQPSIHTVDGLARRTHSELDALYRAASPIGLADVEGELDGRLLALRGAPAPVARVVRRVAASRLFPWLGKAFTAADDAHGAGSNRVSVPGVLGRQQLFPFTTSIGPSAVDGRPAVLLDYDLDANPGYIRRIRDELREVAPGLFLGPAMWRRARGPLLVLWFALATAA